MSERKTEAVPTVLLVDDHPGNRLALASVLEPLEYRVLQASSGEEALRLLEEQHVVLILMDVHMPGLDGYETTARIRENARWKDIPIVFLTAVYREPEHTRRGYALGAVDYISKPFDTDVLRRKVRALVTLYTRGQEAERARNDAAEHVRDLFLGAIGHDLRSPLQAVLFTAKAMLENEALTRDRQVKYARRLARSGEKMHRLIENLLDLTRRELAGGYELQARPTDLGEICRHVMEEQAFGRPDRVVLFETTGDTRGTWDPDQLERVVTNLVGNALDHQEGPILLRLRDEGEWVILVVSNGGPPIDPLLLRTLFEPFHRGEDSRGAGLGLGLYIVREIVSAHKGRVEVSSTAEATTFTVALPRTTLA